MISHKLLIPLRMPIKHDPLEIGYWENNISKFTIVDTSYGWNYHKGARLQWLGKSNIKFIYNSVVDDRPCAFVYNILEKSKTKILYPIDTVSPMGECATSFSYQRLNKLMPGYGYNCVDNGELNEKAPENTGLFLIDLNTNKRKMIYSLKMLSEISPDKTMIGANHFVTHTEFSPDGEYISFLHRWTFDDPNKRYSRLITCRIDGSELSIAKTTGMVSHYVWDKNHGILAYCQMNGIDGHYIFKDQTLKEYYRVAEKLNSDGHQSYVPNTDSFITDTYPDRCRYARLYMVNIINNTVQKIAEVKSYKEFQSPNIFYHWACDLHPRVSPSGKYVCFDSVHTKKRAMCFMKLIIN